MRSSRKFINTHIASSMRRRRSAPEKPVLRIQVRNRSPCGRARCPAVGNPVPARPAGSRRYGRVFSGWLPRAARSRAPVPLASSRRRKLPAPRAGLDRGPTRNRRCRRPPARSAARHGGRDAALPAGSRRSQDSFVAPGVASVHHPRTPKEPFSKSWARTSALYEIIQPLIRTRQGHLIQLFFITPSTTLIKRSAISMAASAFSRGTTASGPMP
jgi:hypothetical protein